MKTSAYKRKTSRKPWLIPLSILVIAAVGILAYLHLHKPNTQPATVSNKNGSSKSASKLSNNGSSKQTTVSTDANQGTAQDKNGQVPTATTSPSQWTTSSSGKITLKQPVAHAIFKPGDTLSGAASVQQVQYRLIDDQVGVVAQGFLNVVNGNFAGVMQFQPHGTSGRLDVFSTDNNGAETNEVQVPVNFSK